MELGETQSKGGRGIDRGCRVIKGAKCNSCMSPASSVDSQSQRETMWEENTWMGQQNKSRINLKGINPKGFFLYTAI